MINKLSWSRENNNKFQTSTLIFSTLSFTRLVRFSDHRELNLERFKLANYLANGRTEVPEAKFEAATDAFIYLCNILDDMRVVVDGLEAGDERRDALNMRLLDIQNLRKIFDRERILWNEEWKRALRERRRHLGAMPRRRPAPRAWFVDPPTFLLLPRNLIPPHFLFNAASE